VGDNTVKAIEQVSSQQADNSMSPQTLLAVELGILGVGAFIMILLGVIGSLLVRHRERDRSEIQELKKTVQHVNTRLQEALQAGRNTESEHHQRVLQISDRNSVILANL